MLMSKELDNLGRTYNPKVIIYNSDGGGRDQYINTNNGGFYHCANHIRSSENFETPKYVHYYNLKYYLLFYVFKKESSCFSSL